MSSVHSMGRGDFIRPVADETDADFGTAFVERNACITHTFGARRSRHALAGPLGGSRWHQYQQAVSLRHVAPRRTLAVLYGFSEYTLHQFQLLTMRAAETVAERKSLQQRCTQHHGLGLLVPFSFNNVYHAIFHAVPTLEWARERGYSEDVLQTATFIPLLHPRLAERLARGLGESQRWYAWEFSLRALTQRSSREIQAELRALLSARCTCFERLEGSARPFNFNAKTATPRMHAFRRTLLGRIGHLGPVIGPVIDAEARSPAFAAPASPSSPHSSQQRVLYIPRLARVRAITNERELHKALCAAVPGLRRVVFDQMPLVEQMRAVGGASSMVAAFGQALTWMILMTPSGVRWKKHPRPRIEVLEIAPRGAFWKKDYDIIASVLGLAYKRVFAQTADNECTHEAVPKTKVRWQQRLAAFKRWLFCNMTVNVSAVVEEARRLV